MIPVFLSTLHCELVASGWWQRKWRLTKPLMYHSVLLDMTIIVQSGFMTDFASVPRIPFIWWVAGATAQRAAIIHDYLYRAKRYSRKVCDQVFLEAMKATGISLMQRYIMYWAVRAFGNWAYKQKQA